MKIYPTCATEEYASIRLMWFSRMAAREPRIIPSSPKARITSVTPSSTISSMEKTRRIITSSSTMYPFSTRPDKMAEDAVVAPPWASGSHRWKGNMALLTPRPATSSPTATVSGSV